MNPLAHLQRPDRPDVPVGYVGPRIATIYGFASREHMQRHWLRRLRESGYADTTMYGHVQGAQVTIDLRQAAEQGRPVALLGFSQGGLEAVDVTRRLAGFGVRVNLLVLLAARGKGRIFPHRWRADMRHVPANVDACLNAFSEADHLGSDARREDNLMVATDPRTQVENIDFPAAEGIDHIGISRCYPVDRLPASLKASLIDRVLAELSALAPAPGPQSPA